MMSIRSVRSGIRSAAGVAVLPLLFACGAPPPTPPGASPSPRPAPVPPSALPDVPSREGALAIDVVYPAEGQTLGVRDSTFVFGSVGTGSASLQINGSGVDVAANGAFLAFLPVPPDGIYQAVAMAGGATQTLSRRVNLPSSELSTTVPDAGVQEYFVVDPEGDRIPAGWQAEVRTQRQDHTAIGRALPGSGTPYNWFFPEGTRLFVTGRLGSQFRVRLTESLDIWVDSADVAARDPSGRVPQEGQWLSIESQERGTVGTVAATPYGDFVDVVLSTSDRLPFRVDEGERDLVITVYGASTRTNVVLYGPTDPLIERMAWEQVSNDVYRLRIDLTAPLWGYLPFFDAQGRVVVRIRRPPQIDPTHPLRGLYIGVDAGHPPGGAIGPTRLTEAEATLGVSQRLARMLEERGARVLQTRVDTSPVDLGLRPLSATQAGVHLLVSVHFDAFGDGVNPFENHGTHVFYNQAPSLDLARAVQRELLMELGLRDLGVSRRDLALVRPTWMPSILSESAFMMVPRNEAALRDPLVLERIASAHLRGIEAFLRSRAGAPER